MTTIEFNEILDFAVEREKDAVSFYRSLQNKAKFADQKQMLKEMEQMEMGHIMVIEGIRNKGVREEDIKHIPNLKISEYLTKELAESELTYQSILIKAMKREENSVKLYTEMSQKFPDSEISTLFRRLASDEAKHKLHFEQLYDDFISQGN
ncbi:MAG: ferritin family protein [Candidatus Cloacimonetes bacterium]|jgi:rubrerythrin|nr:ferritin family protein [Candidatus Cloacimonadota bacterium]MDY0171355.1 ferritin family protein [Candidatus Cloacimonadaceae bacterium]